MMMTSEKKVGKKVEPREEKPEELSVNTDSEDDGRWRWRQDSTVGESGSAGSHAEEIWSVGATEAKIHFV